MFYMYSMPASVFVGHPICILVLEKASMVNRASVFEDY